MMKWHYRPNKRIGDPWIVELLKSFKLHELQSRSFGVNCCRVLENEEFCEEYDAFLKLITDGVYIIRALFTSNSVKNFHERKAQPDPSSGETDELNWKKMILLLEEYKIVHRMMYGKYGELALQVDKFSLIGSYPNMLEFSSTMTLEHANRDSAVQKKCQDIWESRQLNENSESLQLDTDMFLELKSLPKNEKVRISLENVTSAKSFLVISEKEQEWNIKTKAPCTTKRSVDEVKTNWGEKLRADNDVEKLQDDSLSSNPPNIINRKSCLINHNSQNGNCIPVMNDKESPEKEDRQLKSNNRSNRKSNLFSKDKVCDEIDSRTAESDLLVHPQILSQSESSNSQLNLKSSTDKSEIILDNYSASQKSVNFIKQCTHRLISKDINNRKYLLNEERKNLSCTKKRSIAKAKTNCSKRHKTDDDMENLHCILDTNDKEAIPCNSSYIKEMQPETLDHNNTNSHKLSLPSTDRVCDEANFRTAESNSLVHSRVPDQLEEESSFRLYLESSLDNNETIPSDYKSANYTKQCYRQIILEDRSKDKRSHSANSHESSQNGHFSADFKKQCIHKLSKERITEKRLLTISCPKSPNQTLGNSLLGVFEHNNDLSSDCIIDRNVEWNFSAHHIRAMCDKFLELYSEN